MRPFESLLRLCLLTVCLGMSLGGARPAWALESAPVTTAHATVTLLSDTDRYAPGHPFRLGLRFKMAPGWHIYGKDPGDSGLPPELTFTLPQGVTAGPIDWPPTQRLHEGPLTVNAYTGQIVLPVTLQPGQAHGSLSIALHANWLICETICVPEEGDFRLSLPEGDGQPSAEAALLAVGAATGAATGGSPSAVLPAEHSGGEGADQPGLPAVLLFAVLGGLLLNLMPCVFPVLAMKALALAKLGRGERGTVRRHALAYTAGVLLAFLALGLAAVGLRQAGTAVGWGFQFASPAFVAGMAWLLMGVGLNLSGVFQFGAGMMGAGQSLAGRQGILGSLFTGLLAVVVATPCTAPFMGVALAVALNAPPITMLVILLTMGVGLALPYLLIALFPRLVAVMPKPGRWMEILKQALAFPVYASVCWLVWVIAQEAGAEGVLIAGSGLVAIGFAGWAWGAAQSGAGAGWLGRGFALLALAGGVSLLPGLRQSALTGNPAEAGESMAARQGAEAFSSARLDQLRAAGKPVFVNMTAAWCVTCLVNERVALSNAAVRQVFQDRHVAYLLGDWTRQDPEITAFLQAHGRDGVPLYLFYPAGGGQPVLLPQLLTPDIVIRAIGG